MSGSGPDPSPAVSVVVVSYNTREDLRRCLGALRRHARLPLELIVVDNASADGSPEAVRREFPEARLLESADNVGFARANNLGVREAHAPFVLILNSDAEVGPGAVETLAALLEARPRVGIVGPRTRDADGLIQVSSGPFLGPLAEWRQRRLVAGVRARQPGALRWAEDRFGREHEPDWVSGSCLMVRRDVLAAVGGFDERFFLYEEDVDLCLRVRRAGWRVLYTPLAEVVHHAGKSMAQAPERARFEYHRSHLLYYRKHRGRLLTALLGAHLALRAGSAWLAALGPGKPRRGRRQQAVRWLHLALRGR